LEEAELIRSEGRRDNTRIQAEAARRREQILADARRRALEITGQADATRNCIFAGAYDGIGVKVEEIEANLPESVPGSAQRADSGVTITCAMVDGGAARDAQRAEFFAFYRSLQAYEVSLKKGESTILLSPDSEFFRYFNNLEGRRQ
jgi:membrane protease subunit HflC